MISRRAFLVSAAAAGLAASAGVRPFTAEAATDPLMPLWQAWKRIHVSSAGRVIDRLQDNVSHSEGQGYALLVAEALGDREGFERILDWTLTNLAVRDDALLAWRWHPAEGGRVTDLNNASDGDLFAAWALVRAAERFGESRYSELAKAIAADLAAACLRPCPGRDACLVLLPGAVGFEAEDGFVINPAYIMPRAMAELGAATGETAWVAAAADGTAILAELARERLVPDWTRITPERLRRRRGQVLGLRLRGAARAALPRLVGHARPPGGGARPRSLPRQPRGRGRRHAHRRRPGDGRGRAQKPRSGLPRPRRPDRLRERADHGADAGLLRRPAVLPRRPPAPFAPGSTRIHPGMLSPMKTSLLALGLVAVLAAGSPTGSRAADLTEADLAALRYFQSIDDQASVAAEIDRLETEFPGADVRGTLAAIDEKANEVDTTPIWQKIDAEDFPAARKLIADFKGKYPTWTPPAEMISVLDGKEGQARFEAAVAAQDLAGAIQALADFPAILTCDRINNPWRLAEMYVAAGRKPEALATYDGILKTCSSEDFVVATLQKASAIAEKPELASLFGVARGRSPALAGRLATLETELMGPAAPAEPAGGTVVAAAVRSGGGSGSSGGGGGGGDGQLARARAAADRGDWATCLELTTGGGSLAYVSQRSWCAYNFGRPREAIEGFRRVAQSGGSAGRDATYGMILSYARLGQLEQAASLASRAELTRQQRQVVNQTVISKLAVSSFEARQYRTTLGYLDRLSREAGPLDRGLAMLRGWALLKSGQKGAAREQFRRIHTASPGPDSHQGLVELR